MSKERILVGASLCFISGVVLTQPPEFWMEIFSIPRLIARWLDAGVLACAGLWLGLAFAGKQEASVVTKVNELDEKVKQAQAQLQGCHAGLAQFQAILQQHAQQLQKLSPLPVVELVK